MDGRCLLCGRPAGAGAACCDSGRVIIERVVELDDPFGRPAPPARSRSAVGASAALVVPVIAVLVALVAVALGLGSDAEEADEQTLVEPPPLATPKPADELSQTSAAVLTSDGVTMVLGSGRTLDLLPEMVATHVVVARGMDIAFLDLSSGAWTLHARATTAVPVSSPVPDGHLVPFAGGVLTPSPLGGAAFVPPDAPARLIDAGSILGVHGETAFTRGYRGSNVAITAVDVDGVIEGHIDLPPLAIARGITPGGAVVIERAGDLFTWPGEGDVLMTAQGGDPSRRVPTHTSPEVRVVDKSGTHVRVEGGRLLFHGPTGDPITELALDVLGDRGRYAIALATAS